MHHLEQQGQAQHKEQPSATATHRTLYLDDLPDFAIVRIDLIRENTIFHAKNIFGVKKTYFCPEFKT